jgi:hypothetical protein
LTQKSKKEPLPAKKPHTGLRLSASNTAPKWYNPADYHYEI